MTMDVYSENPASDSMWTATGTVVETEEHYCATKVFIHTGSAQKQMLKAQD